MSWRANFWTDEWAELCDALGVDYSHLTGDDLNSRELSKLVTAWGNEHGHERVERAARRIDVPCRVY